MKALNPPRRLLYGPGPSQVAARVYEAMGKPIVGHLDPYFFEISTEIRDMLKECYGTANPFTLAISATGSAGMETSVANFVEPGSKFAVFANGFFCDRLSEMGKRQGANVVGAIVGSGWYGVPKLLFQVEWQYADGTTGRTDSRGLIIDGVITQLATGPILENSVFDGEVYDARLEKPGWDTPEDPIGETEFIGDWTAPTAVESPGGRLIAQMQEPIRVVDTLRPQSVKQPKPGVFVFDVGQNMAGWARLTVQGARGTRVTMRFGEMLYEDGTVDQENLRSALARDIYILRGEGVETWEPRFTYHGFRYIQVDGYPGTPTLDSVQARVVRSAVEPVGTFECDHPLVNQLYRAVWWTEASNLHGIPTDCPQRDERQGWLNDMAARSEEAVYNFDLSRLWPKWMNDIADSQNDEGAVPDTAPYRWGSHPGDPVSVCYLLVPWLLYRHYGNRHVLEDQYEGNRRWVDFLTSQATDYIVSYSYFGDWAPPASETVSGSIGTGAVSRSTPGPLVSTAHYYYAAVLFSRIAAVLGRSVDVAVYQALAEAIKESFNRHFWDEALGGYLTNSQGCNAIALYMGLVPEERKARTLANLIQGIKDRDYHLTTGNLSTKYILEVLAQTGHADIAFRIVTQTTYPSWGFMLQNGATTIWERWEKMTGGGMNSYNHPMYGSVGAWIYRVLGGIQARSEGPGFGRFEIRPCMPDGMNHAHTALKTVRGVVSTAWDRQEIGYSLRVHVPVGSQAQVVVPGLGGAPFRICEGGKTIWATDRPAEAIAGLVDTREEAESVVLTVGSGEYEFQVEREPEHTKDTEL